MTIKDIKHYKGGRHGSHIDLTGPDGNAYVLLAIAHNTLEAAGFPNLAKQCVKGMQAGDYEHLLETFEFFLNSTYTLYRPLDKGGEK